MPRLTDTPVATTVRTPRVRSVGSSEVPDERRHAVEPVRHQVAGLGTERGHELDRRRAVEEMLGSAQHGRHERAVGGRAGPVGPEPGRAVDDGDAERRGPRPAAGPCWARPRPARPPRPAPGSELRSPTTPRWISMVSTARRPVRRAHSDRQAPAVPYRPVAGRSVPRGGPLAPAVGLLGHLGHDGVGPLVVGLAARRPLDRVHHVELAGHLVAGDVVPAVLLDGLEGRVACPARGSTMAATRWPKRSSGAPTTMASMTSGWERTADSTSSGKIFSPPELMQIEPRPSRVTEPSASTVAKSPGITNLLAVDVDEHLGASSPGRCSSRWGCRRTGRSSRSRPTRASPASRSSSKTTVSPRTVTVGPLFMAVSPA